MEKTLSRFSDLLDVHKQVLQQRDDYYVESETLRRTATPRSVFGNELMLSDVMH